jgi:hypothetical protein
MGHSQERSRGDSRLRDWPDAEWRLMRKDENPASARYFTAFGRDVDVAEQRLEYDATTRRLTISGGSRKNEAANAAFGAMLRWVQTENAKGHTPTQNAIADGLADYPKKAIVDAIKLAIRRNRIATTDGPNRSKLHTVIDDRETVDVLFSDTVLMNDNGQPIPSVVATCSRCQHSTESYGVKEASLKRCLALMGKECPKGEHNFYVEKTNDDPLEM